MMASIPKTDLIALLNGASHHPLAAAAIESLSKDKRDIFEAGATRASNLAESLAIKFRIADDKGRSVTGGADLLDQLRELGDTPVTVIGLPGSRGALGMYVLPERAVIGIIRVGTGAS